MNRFIIASAVLALGFTGQAVAVCGSPSTQVTGVALTTLLGGNTACVGSPGNWQSQELHSGVTAGNIVDYKLGPSDAVDPSETIGTYTIDETASTVKYDYSGGSSYTYSVWDNSGGSYTFCGTTNVDATIKSGSGACP